MSVAPAPAEAKSTTTTPSFSLGSKPAETPKAGGFSLGAKPAEPATADAAKPSGFSLGAKPAAATDAAKPAGFSFGAKPAAADAAKPAGATDASKPSGFSLGAKPAAATDAAKPAGFSFGAKPAEPATTDAAKPAGFSLGSKPAEPATADAAKPTGFSLGAKPTATTDAAKSTETTKVDVPLEQVSIANKTLEDLIAQWTTQLRTTAQTFDMYTQQVRGWDHTLVASGEKIAKLYADSVENEALQLRIEGLLTYIELQQLELDRILGSYEQQAERLLLLVDLQAGASAGALVDQTRENAYSAAERLLERLENMETDLALLVKEVNTVGDLFSKSLLPRARSEEEGVDQNPVEDVVRLLGLHAESLKWIEQEEAQLRQRVAKLRQAM